MATILKTIAVQSARGAAIKEISECNATAISLTGSAGTVYAIWGDNRNNPNTDAWLKLYNSATPTVGTTAPRIIVRIPKGDTIGPLYCNLGVTFDTAISAACVVSGGHAGDTSPDNDVNVKVYI